METIGIINTTLQLSSRLAVVAFCCCCWLAHGALASATESQPSITYYLLPQGDARCQLASSRLRCLDQSVIVAAAEPPPPLSAGGADAILEDFVLCGGSATTWAAVGCTQDDIGDLAWQLAFLVTEPSCGDRLVFNSSLDSPLVLRHQHWQSLPGGSPHQTVTFGCRTHTYPYLHRPAYKFTQMFWHNSSSGGRPVNVTIHVYARFHPDLSPSEYASTCAWRNGFWCHQGNATCVYSTHQCNGYDDCLDAPPRLSMSSSEAGVGRPQNATISTAPGSASAAVAAAAAAANAAGGVSSDELGCRYNGHSGGGGQLIHDAHGYPWDAPTKVGERITSSGWSAVLLLLLPGLIYM